MSESPQTFDVLGYDVRDVSLDVFASLALALPKTSSGAATAIFANTHVLTTGRINKAFDRVLRDADFLLPDGMPLVWVGRARGRELPGRVYGPDFMQEVLARTRETGERHYFYGGRAEDADRMDEALRRRYPGVRIVGHECPPFREPTDAEALETIGRINRSDADFVWVGLGCPKQEIWMHRHRHAIRARMLLGVGQAFDIVAGSARQAPPWMRNSGLEWLFRLCLQPRRLWRRYVLGVPAFILMLAADEARRLRKPWGKRKK